MSAIPPKTIEEPQGLLNQEAEKMLLDSLLKSSRYLDQNGFDSELFILNRKKETAQRSLLDELEKVNGMVDLRLIAAERFKKKMDKYAEMDLVKKRLKELIPIVQDTSHKDHKNGYKEYMDKLAQLEAWHKELKAESENTK